MRILTAIIAVFLSFIPAMIGVLLVGKFIPFIFTTIVVSFVIGFYKFKKQDSGFFDFNSIHTAIKFGPACGAFVVSLIKQSAWMAFWLCGLTQALALTVSGTAVYFLYLLKRNDNFVGFVDKLFNIAEKSEWDGIRYVETISGTEFWHTCSINKKDMKIYGQKIAFELDPDGPRIRQQSASTIVGELIFLLQTTEMADDVKGANYVAIAITSLLENHEKKLPLFSQMEFIAAGYLNYI
jgi:hypothetical protein